MKKGNLTRQQAQAIVGSDLMSKLDQEHADFTNRVLDSDDVEFAATVSDDNYTITVYYYMDAAAVAECDDLSNLTWDAWGYEIN